MCYVRHIDLGSRDSLLYLALHVRVRHWWWNRGTGWLHRYEGARSALLPVSDAHSRWCRWGSGTLRWLPKGRWRLRTGRESLNQGWTLLCCPYDSAHPYGWYIVLLMSLRGMISSWWNRASWSHTNLPHPNVYGRNWMLAVGCRMLACCKWSVRATGGRTQTDWVSYDGRFRLSHLHLLDTSRRKLAWHRHVGRRWCRCHAGQTLRSSQQRLCSIYSVFPCMTHYRLLSL